MAEQEQKKDAAEAPAAKKPRAPKRTAGVFKRQIGVANITVVGVGGGGSNTVNRLMQEHPVGMNFVCANTDARALQSLKGEGLIVVPIGETLTRGFGAGGNPAVGEKSAMAERNALKQVISGSDIVFVCSGMGGGTGTGAAPVVAEIAKKTGALTIAMVTLPFNWEGQKRMQTALSGLAKLRDKVDSVILVHNDLIGKLVSSDTPMSEAFKVVDDTVTEGILVINEIVNTPGEINVDLADIRAIFSLPGNSVMSIAIGNGMDAAVDAAQNAIKNKLLGMSVAGAKGVLFTVKGGRDLTLKQVNAAGKLIANSVDPDAMIFFGMSTKPELGNRVKLTLIATGIPDNNEQA